MEQPGNDSLPMEVISQLRRSGHFLYWHMGSKVGRGRILGILAEKQEILQKDLQDLLGVKSGTLSEMIIAMEADHFVEKVRSRTDARRLVLRITAQGRAEAARTRKLYEEQVSRMMECFSQEELGQLNRLLDRMLSHWDSMAQQPSRLTGTAVDGSS